jgi:hypothetical protein
MHDRTQRLEETDEIAGNQLGALMDQLIERVLAIVPGSPQMIGPVW